jgi:hypothetical protein
MSAYAGQVNYTTDNEKTMTEGGNVYDETGMSEGDVSYDRTRVASIVKKDGIEGYIEEYYEFYNIDTQREKEKVKEHEFSSFSNLLKKNLEDYNLNNDELYYLGKIPTAEEKATEISVYVKVVLNVMYLEGSKNYGYIPGTTGTIEFSYENRGDSDNYYNDLDKDSGFLAMLLSKSKRDEIMDKCQQGRRTILKDGKPSENPDPNPEDPDGGNGGGDGGNGGNNGGDNGGFGQAFAIIHQSNDVTDSSVFWTTYPTTVDLEPNTNFTGNAVSGSEEWEYQQGGTWVDLSSPDDVNIPATGTYNYRLTVTEKTTGDKKSGTHYVTFTDVPTGDFQPEFEIRRNGINVTDMTLPEENGVVSLFDDTTYDAGITEESVTWYRIIGGVDTPVNPASISVTGSATFKQVVKANELPNTKEVTHYVNFGGDDNNGGGGGNPGKKDWDDIQIRFDPNERYWHNTSVLNVELIVEVTDEKKDELWDKYDLDRDVDRDDEDEVDEYNDDMDDYKDDIRDLREQDIEVRSYNLKSGDNEVLGKYNDGDEFDIYRRGETILYGEATEDNSYTNSREYQIDYRSPEIRITFNDSVIQNETIDYIAKDGNTVTFDITDDLSGVKYIKYSFYSEGETPSYKTINISNDEDLNVRRTVQIDDASLYADIKSGKRYLDVEVSDYATNIAEAKAAHGSSWQGHQDPNPNDGRRNHTTVIPPHEFSYGDSSKRRGVSRIPMFVNKVEKFVITDSQDPHWRNWFRNSSGDLVKQIPVEEMSVYSTPAGYRDDVMGLGYNVDFLLDTVGYDTTKGDEVKVKAYFYGAKKANMISQYEPIQIYALDIKNKVYKRLEEVYPDKDEFRLDRHEARGTLSKPGARYIWTYNIPFNAKYLRYDANARADKEFNLVTDKVTMEDILGYDAILVVYDIQFKKSYESDYHSYTYYEDGWHDRGNNVPYGKSNNIHKENIFDVYNKTYDKHDGQIFWYDLFNNAGVERYEGVRTK